MNSARGRKPSCATYALAQTIAFFISTFVFRRKVLRNELRGVRGAYIIIANHECKLDFVNLIGLTRRPMNIVVSSSFYQTLSFRRLVDKMGLISKQQFQSTPSDLKAMRDVILAGRPLVLYPAGLMSEDGLSTPIPEGTSRFLKWLDADVYAARTAGTYFVMPKWSKRLRPGRTTMDAYKLISREELAQLDESAICQRVENALLFDAYAEQEALNISYRGGEDVEGLENVLYLCPRCRSEFSIHVKEKSRLVCSECGYALESDDRGMFRGEAGQQPLLRHASQWSRLIDSLLREQLAKHPDAELASAVHIQMIDEKAHRFVDVGDGRVTLSRSEIRLCGTIAEKEVAYTFSVSVFPTLPFAPGQYLELQKGKDIFRCYPTDGQIVMKFIRMLKIFHLQSRETNRMHS